MTQTTHTTPDYTKQIPIPLGKGSKRVFQTIVTTRPGTDFTDEKHPPRSYCFFIRTYLPVQAIRELLPECKAWAFILHDKDDKEPHHHLLLGYESQHTLVSVAGKLLKLAKLYPVNGHPQSSYIEIPYSKSRCYAYLTHSDPASQQAEKHVYSDAEVLCENADYFDDTAQYNSKARYNVVDVLDSINNGTSYREMATKYGASFVCNYTKFRDYAWNMQSQETPEDEITDDFAMAYGSRDYLRLISICIERLAYDSVIFPSPNLADRNARLDAIDELLSGAHNAYVRKVDEFYRMRQRAEVEQDLQRLCIEGTEIKEA